MEERRRRVLLYSSYIHSRLCYRSVGIQFEERAEEASIPSIEILRDQDKIAIFRLMINANIILEGITRFLLEMISVLYYGHNVSQPFSVFHTLST
jgi:hypothetical protein